jgi:hypothetical protein
MSINRNNGSRPRLVDPDPEPIPERDDPSADNARSSTNRTRQGVTGHNVRYVLVFALAGVVLAFIPIYTAFSGSRP